MRKRRGAARLLVIAGVVVAVGVVGAAVSTVLSGRGGGTPAGKLDWERPESVSGDPFRFADLVSFGDDGTPLLSSPDPVAHAVVKYGAAYAQDRRNPTGAAPEALPDWFAPRVGEMVAGVAGGDPTEATELSELLLLERVADLPGTFVAAEDHPSLVDALTGVGSPETLLLRIELALALDDEAAADALVRVPEQDACTLAGAAPSNPDLGGYLAYEMLRPRYDCVTAAVDGMVAQWAAASGPQVLRAVVRGELVDAPGAEALVTTFADQNLAARSAIGFTPSDLVDQVLAELTLDRETDPLVYSSARRTLGTGAAVSDSISGDYALDAYLFAELDEATRFDVWAPAATPAAQVERAGGWEPLFALGAGFTPDDPDHPALVEQLAAGCGVTSPVDFTGREIPPFAVVTAVLADLAGESCDTLDVATAVELASESAAMPTAATPMFRAWVSAYAGCRYADGPPGDDAVRTAVADLVPDDEPAWSFRTDPTDYYAMFDSYATGWLDALTGDRFDCASLTPWGGTQPEPTFETTEPPQP